MAGSVVCSKTISRQFVRDHPDSYFVFGDNMIGRGLGGQAAAMRGEPNSIGVPTKWTPRRDKGAYFSDDDWDISDVRHALFGAFSRIKKVLEDGHDVYIPADGLGTGLADLPRRAPKIHRYIAGMIESIASAYASF